MPQPVFLPGGTPMPQAQPFHLPSAPPQFRPAAPTSAGLATGNIPAPAAPKFRAQAPDPVPQPPSRIILPTPESLGIGVRGTAAANLPAAGHVATPLDWNQTHQRLKDLGAVGFHLDRVGAQVRVTFWLPTAEPGRTQLVESTAVSESEAVSAALHQAHSFRLASR